MSDDRAAEKTPVSELSPAAFDLDRVIATRLSGGEPGNEVHLQAIAILIDAELTDAERARALAAVMTELLEVLSTDERERFCQIARQDGEAAAMTYLSGLTRPSKPDRA